MTLIFRCRSLNNKNTALRQSLARIRLARESLKNRLKIHSWHQRNVDRSKRYTTPKPAPQSAAHPWNGDFPSMNNEDNGSPGQRLHARYLCEIEKLTRKLEQRDETLKRVLQAKSGRI